MRDVFHSQRPAPADRKFTSAAVEAAIEEISAAIADPELAWLFQNCYPNTLDTTVTFQTDADGQPDTFVITGDIHAMWLRDSTNQVWPYLPLVKTDARLAELFRGLINRQAACVRLDPYANAFYRTPEEVGHWENDHTEMRPGVHERKYELDSLCSVLRLATGYFFQTRDASCFHSGWLTSVGLILQTMRREQAGSDEQGETPSYVFRRTTPFADDTLSNQGRGNPFLRTGMTRSPFRPSDDAGTFQHLVPANAMAVVCLRDLVKVLTITGLAPDIAADAAKLADEIDAGIRVHGCVNHSNFGTIYAYEVDGFGGVALMDDANVPSLLSLPYIGYCDAADPIYQATRRFVLSQHNPYFFRGESGEGVGGPHIGCGWIWPLAIAMRGLTSNNPDEIRTCLRLLKESNVGTGFMHESFWKNDASRFTRPWFAWANTLFGEFVQCVYNSHPALLREPL